MGYLFLFLLCVSLIAYFIYDCDQSDNYFNFLLQRNKIGPFLKSHDFIYFMTCFFGTAIPAVGTIYFFIKLIIFLITKCMGDNWTFLKNLV